MRLPACKIKLAAINSPTIIVKFGAIVIILVLTYMVKVCLFSVKNIIWLPNSFIIKASSVETSLPIEISTASLIWASSFEVSKSVPNFIFFSFVLMGMHIYIITKIKKKI